MNEPVHTQPDVLPGVDTAVSPAAMRAKRVLIVGLAVFGVLFVGMVVLLVVLARDAYGTAPEQSPGAAVISLLRDAAIVLVALETLIIGALLVVLTLQVQSLIGLLRDEIRPMLESVNETVATVRGTAQFMSHNVISPTVRAAGFLAGVRRVAKGIVDLAKHPREETGDR